MNRREPRLEVAGRAADEASAVLPGLMAFIRESNRIEGITRAPTRREVAAHLTFLELEAVRVPDMEAFVAVVAPGKPIRDRAGMRVFVGNHEPPGGGANVIRDLMGILGRANSQRSPYAVHQAYETLHPFMDGNGRSGRVLWLWMMLRQESDPWVMKRGFLHTFYYQALEAANG